ncbi:MAG: hypothetical protein ISS36_02680 [Candidatus Aenigmarchaeota archaeon]|nr:hypothetical protein [Candidatus Aenigmarchaeota archaeon]
MTTMKCPKCGCELEVKEKYNKEWTRMDEEMDFNAGNWIKVKRKSPKKKD